MREKKISQEAIAKSLGNTRGAVGHYLSGRRQPSLQQLETIAEKLEVHPAWLLYGKQVMEIREDAAIYSPYQHSISKIPITGTSITGPSDVVETYINLPLPTVKCYGLSIASNEYSPRIFENEAVLVDPDIKPSPGDDVIIKNLKNNEVKLYSLIGINNTYATFDSLTRNQKQQIIPAAEILYMHCIIAVIRANSVER